MLSKTHAKLISALTAILSLSACGTAGTSPSNLTNSNSDSASGYAVITAAADAVSTVTPVYAIHVGGTAYTSTTGVNYAADKLYTGGTRAQTSADFAGTTDDAIYRTERWGSFSYNLPIANGSYDVTLEFRESAFSAINKRVFNVIAEGQTVIQNLDIFKAVGGRTALDKVVTDIQVTDGVLSLKFAATVDSATLSGIVVRAASTSSSSSSGGVADTTKPTAPGSVKTSNILNKQMTVSWAAATDNVAVTQYKIFRNGAQVGLVAANALTYTDTGLVPNTSYSYTVKALDAAGNESLASAALSAKTFMVGGTVNLTWVEPSARVNGDRLYKTDIGGYKVRYKLASASSYTQVTVPAGATTYSLANLIGDYVIEVATYDVQGYTSDYVVASLN